jgi:putative phage-type endonuclease
VSALFEDWETPAAVDLAVTHFASACEFTGATDDNRENWLGHRRGLLTASAMAAIIGEDPYSDAYDVYVEKTEGKPRAEPTIEDGPIFWGKVLEQPILTTVAKSYGWNYRKGGALLRSKRWPAFGCTLDAEIDRLDARGWGVLEGKTSVLIGQWDEATGELPTRVLIQAQHQLLVTGAPFCVVFALLSGSRKCMIEVEPSAEFFAMLIDEGEAFLEMIARGECPSPTYRSHVRERFPRDNGSTIHLPLEYVELTRSYFEIQKEIDRLEHEAETIRNKVRNELAEATYGRLAEPVGDAAVWRNQVNKAGHRTLRTLKDFPKGHPELAAQRARLLSAPVTLHARIESSASSVVAQRFKKGRLKTR